MKKNARIITIPVLCVVMALGACSGKDGAMGPAGMPGADGGAGPAGPGGVEIYSIVADPAVVRPGASTTLSVSAGDGAGSGLTYLWQAASGSFGATDAATVVWTSPGTVGSYIVSVEVTNGDGLTSTGYASILVSVSPAGPIVTNVSPAEARAGDTVRITGAGFGASQGAGSVSIGGAPASSIVSWSDMVIYADLPAAATTGTVVVTTAGVDSAPGYITVLWAGANPRNVGICTAANSQGSAQIIPDGSGGAIIAWGDNRGGSGSDIYAQRVYNGGTAQWTTDGVAVSAAANNQSGVQIIPDGSGGAIIAWIDNRSGSSWDIYAQRVDGSGTAQWTADGVVISAAANLLSGTLKLIPDGSGGAIIVWTDFRNGNLNREIYAQRVDGSGVAQWTADGVAISTAADIQQNPELISDGSGGAIIVWEDHRSGSNWDIYAQRVNGSGVAQWTTDGVAISTAAGFQQRPRIIPDGSGGAIIAWHDLRSGVNYDIYAQRVNGGGAAQWTADGVVVSAAANNQGNPELIPDGSGGAIIVWTDGRSGNDDIYAQRVNGSGEAQWTTDGVAVSAAANSQQYPELIPDGSGGAIIVWYDLRNVGGGSDIYAQRVTAEGTQ